MPKLTIVLMVALALLGGGCGNPFSPSEHPMTVYNGCGGSWLEISDENHHILIPRLEYGQRDFIDVKEWRGQRVHLLAVGFDLKTGDPLGSAKTSRYIEPISGNGVVYGSDLRPWEVTYLYANGPNTGCRR